MNSIRDFFTSRRPVLGALLILTLLLAACGRSAGDSWAGVSKDPNTNTIYVAFNKRVVALDPSNGTILWEYPDDAKFYAVPVVDNGTVFVGDYKGKLHAIDAETGASRWIYEPERRMYFNTFSPDPTDRVIGGVALDANTVYFGLGSRNVVAVDRETAEEKWIFETDHGVWAMPLLIPGDDGMPGTLYVVSLDQHLYAIDALTGDEQWNLNLGGAAPGNMAYDADRNWVYVGTFVSEVVAVDLNQHVIVDRFPTHGWVWGSPAFYEDTLYVGDLSGTVFAINVTEDGFADEAKWERQVAEDAIRAAPLILPDQGLVVVGSRDKHFYTIDMDDGATLSHETEGQALTNLVSITQTDTEETLVIVGTHDGTHVIAYEYETGKEVWNYSD